jgi:hypothetical protein
MTKRANLDRLLQTYSVQYEKTKARIRKIGFTCKGSLGQRRLPCGTPNCHCHSDPKKLHGPYYQLSWKEKGKTVSHYIPKQMVPLYRQWNDNRRELLEIIDEMESISRKAWDSIRTQKPEVRRKKAGKKTRKIR